jgi:SAM-dependent methyltransferase
LAERGEDSSRMDSVKRLTQPIYGTLKTMAVVIRYDIEVRLNRRDEFVPPGRLLPYTGSVRYVNFKAVGEEFCRYFVELGGLQPNEMVLDVGCGVGRMAIPLTRYLSAAGGYEGFDIIPNAISWARSEITPKYPNFHFQLAPIYSEVYNPRGRYKASEYQFPYESETFDFVFLVSVFTHMFPADMEHYFSEIVRVSKKGGRQLMSFFLMNSESLRLVEAGKSALNLRWRWGTDGQGCRTIDIGRPESAVGHEEEFVLGLYRKHGLQISEPIHYGSWCGRTSFLSYQDIIVSSRV